MSTNTQATPAVTVTVTTTPALVKGVKEACDMQVKLENKFASLADLCRQAATAKGYDRKQSGDMVRLAYTEAGQDIKRKAPDISKILSLAYPAEAAVNALAEAKEHNESAAPSEKIGINDQLRIARDKEGKTTVATILQERKEAAASRGAQNGGAPRVPGTTPAPATMTLDEWTKAFTTLYTQGRVLCKATEETLDDKIAAVVAEFNESITK